MRALGPVQVATLSPSLAPPPPTTYTQLASLRSPMMWTGESEDLTPVS